MKKEIFAAVGIGFILGSLLAVALINLPNIIKKDSKSLIQNIAPSPTSSAVSTANETTALAISSPGENQILTEKTIQVAGIYLPEKTVIIETDNDFKATRTNKDGEFSEKLNINEGVSDIYITSFDNNQEPVTKTITVYYTAEKL